MTEIIIKLNMNDKYDITISNKNNDKEITINYKEKKINAIDIYELLSYNENIFYSIESNIDEIVEGNEKDYFNEIIFLMYGIINEINEINDSNEENLEVNKDLDQTDDNFKEVLDDLE